MRVGKRSLVVGRTRMKGIGILRMMMRMMKRSGVFVLAGRGEKVETS